MCVFLRTENLDVSEDLFEGDVKLTYQQKDASFGRGSITTRKWTGAILPYVIASSLGTKEFIAS